MSLKLLPNSYRRNKLVQRELSDEQLSKAREVIKEHLNIGDYLREHGHAHGEQTKICCPIHLENTPSFFFDVSQGFFNCFGCGKGGTVSELHMYITRLENPNYSYYNSLKDLSKQYNINLPELHVEKPMQMYAKPEVKRVRFPKQSNPEERERMYSQKYLRTIQRYNSLFKNADGETRFNVSCIIDDFYLGLATHKETFYLLEQVKQRYNQNIANQV